MPASLNMVFGLLQRDIPVEDFVQCQRWCGIALPEAGTAVYLHCALAHFGKTLFQFGEDLARAAQVAGHVGTDFDHRLRWWRDAEFRIEFRYPINLIQRNLQVLGERLYLFGGQVPMLVLNRPHLVKKHVVPPLDNA